MTKLIPSGEKLLLLITYRKCLLTCLLTTEVKQSTYLYLMSISGSKIPTTWYHFWCANIQNSGLVPHWDKHVCIFMDNATLTNKNCYLIGWALEIVQYKDFDVIRLLFLVTRHTKVCTWPFVCKCCKLLQDAKCLYLPRDDGNCQLLCNSLWRDRLKCFIVAERTGLEIIVWVTTHKKITRLCC